ncbi:hypothetical protein E4U38_007833 [Claviceps purpurea]|nr:hypothetical protein E4U38_007833 [Claviceps purpurea]KAG6162390.1 hypothetical protein E4U11_002721 [Claviceps purpurea]
MSDTKDFDVIRIARSDGADTGPGYWPNTSGAPKKIAGKEVAMADKTPRGKPQMTRLAEDDPRFIEWRIKLGILLKQELSPHPEEGNPWYIQFPRGYWLYEKSKHLWVSGYPIKSKLFKSPQEFGVHLIWLLTSSSDYKDCCCVHCNHSNQARLAASMDELLIVPNETAVPAPVSASASTTTKSGPSTPTTLPAAASSHKVTPVPLPQIPGKKPTPPAVASVPVTRSPTAKPARPISNTPLPQPQARAQPQSQAQRSQSQTNSQPQSQPQSQQQQQQQPQPQSQTQAQAQAQPRPQSQPQSQQQPQQQPQQQQLKPPPNQSQTQAPTQQPQPVRWSLQGSLLFRIGELTWYQNGNTWRLGIICASTPNSNQFSMLPIGHALVPQEPVTKTLTDLRPFYAFSLPPVVALPNLKDKTFDQVPWDTLFRTVANDPAKRELLALDASKLAASRIDASYSLWCPLHKEHPNADPAPFYGCFFGAERIEIGDCLRIKPFPSDPALAHDSLIMGLRYIFTQKEHPGAVFFRGNVYQLATVTNTNDTPRPLIAQDQLPIALRDEAAWRSQLQPPAKPWRWTLVKEHATLNEQFVKGRFYPIHRLMPILDRANFEIALARGRIEDQIPYLNNRMDGGVSGYVGRKVNRLDCLGVTVKQGSRIGLEDAIREEGDLR